ncbi:MAG: RlmE family RNA methyltransferase [Treponemataceae bacterium]
MKEEYKEPDFWSRKAFSEGYPARSVYKLKEINKKFEVFKNSSKVLDLGAAPGSWTSYALKILEKDGLCVSVDLKPLDSEIKDSRLHFLQGDLYSKGIFDTVKNLGPYDLVICDAAPATTGNKTVDTARSVGLVELAIFYASENLKQGGNFVVKIFQDGSQQELLQRLRTLFKTAKAFKPKASRNSSIETFLVANDFL